MLKSIYIDNYALIEQLEIDFQEGLTIITGETGAGKTILLGALGLLLGKRADTSVLKDLERKCIVEGVFRIEGYGLEQFFRNNELDYQNETLIRREINNSGKSRAFINDTPVNLEILQDLALSLIDIHSQHQNLLLNDETYLRWIIDSYAGTIVLTGEYAKQYHDFQKSKKQYYETREAYQKDQENLDFITHQFNELITANLKENELPELEQEYDQLNHVEEIKSGLEGIRSLFHNEESGVIGNLKHTIDLLLKLKTHFAGAAELEKRVQTAYIELKDIAGEIENYCEKTEFDPIRIGDINIRIDLLYTLLRKHKVNSEAELISIRDQLDKKLQAHATGDYELERLNNELAEKEKLMKIAARQLSQARKKIFAEFEKKVDALLQSLGMKKTQFSINCQETEPTMSGIDRIQFLFSANSNLPMQNISKIASGGELSRLMLTIKYLISNSSGLPTIIFDEIDSGVSGEIADKVGNLVKEMADNMQVINITHLPQVASKGDHHFLVFKSITDSTTKTYIKQLNEKERLNEIAKMLSGDSVTEAAIENARVLLGK
jgi:DNA repair protein RecN (Recombination protein N)